MKRAIYIYLKDIRNIFFSKIILLVFGLLIIGITFINRIPSIADFDLKADLIISTILKLLIIYYGVEIFGKDFFLNPSKIIFSIQQKRTLIYFLKVIANITMCIYFSILHIVIKLLLPNLTSPIENVNSCLNILYTYVLFGLTVFTFSIFTSLLTKKYLSVFFIDFFVFCWSLGNIISTIGSRFQNNILNSIFKHNILSELDRSINLLSINKYTLICTIPFILLFNTLSIHLLKNKDIS